MSEDESWVFDSLVCFLNGPIWNAPLQSFIEERSLIFEPNEPENEEYRKVFDDFKNLVDFMLGNFMEDIGISSQQFEHACYQGAKEGVPLHFDQNTFEQIWAANDYEMFKRMMTQRNVELQLQALELIERKFGKTPELFLPQKKTPPEEQAPQQSQDVATELEREVMVEVSKKFAVDEAKDSEDDNLKFLMEEKLNLEETLKKTIEEKLSTQKLILEEEEKAVAQDVETKTEAVKKVVPNVRIPIDRPQKSEVDNVELKKRQDYLRAQRDKLVALKKEVRKKHLDEEKVSSVETARVRPKSAKAAESLLSGGSSVVEPDQMKLRKALVKRLKSEVIQNKD